MTTNTAPVPATNLDMGSAYTAQEQTALDAILALGVALDPTPEPRPEGAHTMCAFHLYDAAGEELDGGQASSLLGWINDGYIRGAAVIRPVTA